MQQHVKTPRNTETFATPLPSRPTADTLALLESAQITDDYLLLVQKMAGDLAQAVATVFPGPLHIVYLLTATPRRQVWNAVLASHETIDDPDALRDRLLHEKSRVLLREAFGAHVPGYEKVIGKTGPVALARASYKKLHSVMAKEPGLRHELRHADRIDEATLATLLELPKRLRSYGLAGELGRRGQRAKFDDIIAALAKGGRTRASLEDEIMKRLHAGASIYTVLWDLYGSTPFPKPPVLCTPLCIHLDTAEAMVRTGRRFKNCLKNLIPEAIRGEQMFFEWKGEEPAIISICEDRPYGWCLYDVCGRRNKAVSDATMQEIESYFEERGVRAGAQLEHLLRRFFSGRKDHEYAFPFDPLDDILAAFEEEVPS